MRSPSLHLCTAFHEAREYLGNKGMALLDEEGEITPQFEKVLSSVFLRFCDHGETKEASTSKLATITPDDPSPTLSRSGFAAFTQETNGQPLTDETWDEVVEFADTGDVLTFRAFAQLYQLQTENDEEETIRDLKAWGYDPETLELIKHRQDEPDEEKEKPALSELTGIGQGGEKKRDATVGTKCQDPTKEEPAAAADKDTEES